jgi:hypothetical protein
LTGVNFIVNDNGSAKQIAATAVGTAGTSCVQADWNQNDPTAPDYIKNKPFREHENWTCIHEPKVLQNWSGKWVSVYEDGSQFLNNTYSDGAVFKIIVGSDTYVGTYKAAERFVGNSSLLISTNPDTGEDFLISYHGYDAFSVITRKPITAGCEVSVYLLDGTEIDEIDPKYLPNMAPYVIDSEAYTYGDDALAAILEGRPIYIKVPNKSGSTIFSNFMPVLQYQLPSGNNNYLILFYLKDGIAENILVAMQAAMQGNTSAFNDVFGVVEMMLSKSYAECPLKVDPVK